MKFIQIKDIFPDIRVARYNLAVWQKSDNDNLCFIGREVLEGGKLGQPDTGILKLFEVSRDGAIIHEREIWKPLYDGINLEDPRVLEIQDENLIVGLTAVLRDKEGRPVPFPAIVKIDSVKSWKQELPPFLIIETFGQGKNLTPVDNTTYLFRPELADYNHKILIFSLHSQVPGKITDLQFPTNLPWATWRIGTTTPPLWITPDEALFIIHGISIQKINGKDIYVYSIGRAKLTRRGNTFEVKVAPDPIITPDDFLDKNGVPLIEELHPDLRRVVYSCGGIIKKHAQDKLFLYVNVGDKTTFEVEFSLAELKEGLFETGS